MFNYKWHKRAGELQSSVRESENKKGYDYPDDKVRRSIVHSREDIILIVSYLQSVNEQLVIIRLFIIAIIVLFVLLLLKLPRLNNLMQHFGILRRELKEGIKYNESKELQEIVIEGKRRNQSVIGARIIFQEHRGIA